MTLGNLIYIPAVLGRVRALIVIAFLLGPVCVHGEEIFLSPESESTGPDIEIVIGEEKTIYEYRANGVLIAIKVVPKTGRPYYMVPADGSPHFESLDHAKTLYPQWVLFEW